MDDLTVEEIDHIIAELMGDACESPLIVSSDGESWVAGERPMRPHQVRAVQRRIEAAREVRELNAKVEQLERSDREAVAAVQRRARWRIEQSEKLAGDVLHEEGDRVSLRDAIQRALDGERSEQ